MRSRSSSWFAIRTPLSGNRAAFVKIGSFLLPVVVWCAVSYVPWIWHPDIRVTDPGGSDFLQEDMLIPRGDFAQENAKLAANHQPIARGFRANPIFLPAPGDVARAFYQAFTTPPPFEGDPWLHQSLWHSAQIIFWGFVLSAVVGIPVGIICGTFDLFSKLFEPFVDFVRYMPAPAFGALCVAVLGIDDGPKIAIIWIGTFFQMVLVVANTTRQFEVALLEAAQTLGATKRSLIPRVILPGILPNLYNDMRILIGWAWTYLIVAELIGAGSGISYFINQQGKYRHFDNVFAGMLMIGIIGLACDQLLAAAAPILFPWVPRTRGASILSMMISAMTFYPQRHIAARSAQRKAAETRNVLGAENVEAEVFSLQAQAAEPDVQVPGPVALEQIQRQQIERRVPDVHVA